MFVTLSDRMKGLGFVDMSQGKVKLFVVDIPP